jgi:hypothetical protein
LRALDQRSAWAKDRDHQPGANELAGERGIRDPDSISSAFDVTFGSILSAGVDERAELDGLVARLSFGLPEQRAPKREVSDDPDKARNAEGNGRGDEGKAGSDPEPAHGGGRSA